MSQDQIDAISAFGSEEKFKGWANNIAERQSRQKYDKKSRKFYSSVFRIYKNIEITENHYTSGNALFYTKEDTETGANNDEDVIDDVQKMKKKIEEDAKKATSAASRSSKKENDEDSEKEELLKKNAKNKENARGG